MVPLSASYGTTDPVIRMGQSLDGEYQISEVASLTIMGDHQEDIGGRLGSYIGHADINGDGNLDLFASAPQIIGYPGSQNTGRCYIWYGGENLSVGIKDIIESEPDIIIRGSTTDSQIAGIIRSGDIDGDGHIDMVIGNPVQPESGKIYILWGKASGWPSVIDLYPAAGDEPNSYPVGFLNTNDFCVISGQVTTNVLGTHLGKDIEIGDLDGDSYDDVVFSFHGWNAILIGWGGPDRMQFGSDYTYMKEMTDVSRYGYEIELGNLDGQDGLDMVVSLPIIADESRSKTRAGAIYVYYDIGRIKGNLSLPPTTYLRPKIWGKDAYDNLGSTVLMRDIDSDGKDDLIIGGPGSDGIQNKIIDCGVIYVIKGTNITSFPNEAVIDDIADIIIYGSKGKNGEDPGSGIGRTFAVGDINGDNNLELVITSQTEDHGTKLGAGKADIYSHTSVLGSQNTVVDLSKVVPRMTIWGDDVEDTFGSALDILDMDGDGSDEIIISSSAADGPLNSRPASGEIYFISGNPTGIKDLEFTGTGVDNNRILAGSGYVDIRLQIQRYPEISSVNNIEVMIDPNGFNYSISWDRDNSFLVTNDPYGTITLDKDNSGLEEIGNWGYMTVRLRTSILFDLPTDSDITVMVSCENGEISWRSYSKIISGLRDLDLHGDLDILRNGHPTSSVNNWFTNGDTVNISGPRIVYSKAPSLTYSGNELELLLIGDQGTIDSIPFADDWSIGMILDDESEVYNIDMRINPAFIPASYPQIDIPDMGEGISIPFKLDTISPSEPANMTLIPDKGRPSSYDNDDQWSVAWEETVGFELDGQGSGVRKYQYSINGSEWMDVREIGGLWATYYIGRDFQIPVPEVEEIDTTIDHPKSEWNGFSPHNSEIPADAFSIRYHGWFIATESKEHHFSLSGGGDVMMILGDQVIVPWMSLEPIIILPPVFLEEGEIRELIIYMRSNEKEEQGVKYSGISLKLEDDLGMMSRIDSSQLLYPSNKTDFTGTGEIYFNVAIRSVDWVDLSSKSKTSGAYTDMEGPRFDISTINRWYPGPEPTIRFKIIDPNIGNISGSGIDIENVYYRVRERGEDDLSKWEPVELFEDIIQGNDGPVSVNTILEIALDNDWQGVIQFKAQDMVGNEETSSLVDIGVDINGPSFDVIQPNIVQAQDEGNIDVMVKVIDRPGAGCDGSGIEMRYRREDMDYSIWFLMNGSGLSEEVFATYQVFLTDGNYFIQFRATDNIGNTGISEPFYLTIKEVVIDMPPVPVISNPIEGQSYREGSPVYLDSEGTYDDDLGRYPELVYTWFSNKSGFLGSGESLSVYLKETGLHRITLFVDDGTLNHNVSTMVNITMKPLELNNTPDGTPNATDDDDSTLEVLLISSAIVIILAFMMIFIVLKYKKKREEEIQIHYRERTGDEDSYETMLEEEERALGIGIENKELSEEEMEEERMNLYGYQES